MIRGTTPVIILNLPMAIDFEVLYITFKQDRNVVLEKSLCDVKVEGTKVVIPFSQKETLSFDGETSIKVQLRGRVGETAYASKIVRLSMSDILKDGEI